MTCRLQPTVCHVVGNSVRCRKYHGFTRVYPKVSGLSLNVMYAYNNTQSLRSDTKGYGDKTH